MTLERNSVVTSLRWSCTICSTAGSLFLTIVSCSEHETLNLVQSTSHPVWVRRPSQPCVSMTWKEILLEVWIIGLIQWISLITRLYRLICLLFPDQLYLHSWGLSITHVTTTDVRHRDKSVALKSQHFLNSLKVPRILCLGIEVASGVSNLSSVSWSCGLGLENTI